MVVGACLVEVDGRNIFSHTFDRGHVLASGSENDAVAAFGDFLGELEGDALCPLSVSEKGAAFDTASCDSACEDGVPLLAARRTVLESNAFSAGWESWRQTDRSVAHGRLWVIEHTLQGFGGVAKLQTLLVSKRRSSLRTLWGANNPKPAGLQSGASAEARKQAEKAIREALEAKEARLNGTGDLAKRLPGGLPRSFFTARCWPLTGVRPADVDACARMRALRAAVVSWLIALEQRAMLRGEPTLTSSFVQYNCSLLRGMA